MAAKKLRILGAIVLALFATTLWAQGEPPAELVLVGGVVHTLDEARPRASVVVVRDGVILDVLADEGGLEAKGWVGATTRVIDLEGACVVPGLWDAHGHVAGLGRSLVQLDLVGTSSFAEVVERVRERAAGAPKGAWILGRGWDQNDWPAGEFGGGFPTHHALSAAVPDHPVWLRRVDGHAGLANARALEIGRVAGRTSPAGGEILRDAEGAPTGVLVDAAMVLIPSPGDGTSPRELLRLGARECLRHGIVGVHDAGCTGTDVAAYRELFADEDLPFRAYVMLTRLAGQVWIKRGQRVLGEHEGRLWVRAIKVYIDGALGSRGAYLLEPYSDRSETRGLVQLGNGDPTAAEERLARLAEAALAAGFQVNTHAIGDGGNRIVLDAYERAINQAFETLPGDIGNDWHRLRVEHAQVIALDDIPRFGRLGILPSFQPTHATSDMPWAEARIGRDRIRGAYAWQRLRAAGCHHLPLGSDFPVEGVNPLWGIYAAVTRLDRSGGSPHGEGGWFPDQCLTREQALRGFTIDAAYAAFLEHETGTITPGKWADLSIFDRDLMTCAGPELLDARCLMTIVGGEVAYDGRP